MKSIVLVCFLIVNVFAVFPVVFFPGYALVTINVSLNNTNIAGCPSSGSFSIHWQYTENDLNGIPNDCVPKYLELRYSNGKVRNQAGVTLSINNWEIGDIATMHPLYDDLFNYLLDRGYTQGSSTATLRAVGYDWRTVPYLDVEDGGLDNPGFMKVTDKVIRAAYEAAGNEKVYLIGHSNGPIMQTYFLQHQSKSYRDKYIAGSITLSGNIAGQALGSIGPILGFTPQDFSLQPSWTAAVQSFPSTYMTAGQPEVFDGSNEVTILDVNGKTYTTQEYDELYTDAGADFALDHWRDWIGATTPTTKPYGGGVQVFSFYGGQLDTVVGVKVDSLPITEFDGSNTDNYFFLKGDTNQEAIDNESVLVWEDIMPPGCFDHQEVVGVDHFTQCATPSVIQKIYDIISNPVSTRDCSPSDSNSNNSSDRSSSSNNSSNASSATIPLVLLIFSLIACFLQI